MRNIFIVSFAMAIAGCSAENASDNTTPTELLEANDPKICADSDVQRTALTVVDESYHEYMRAGGDPVELQAVSAIGIDPQIHEVRCSAYIDFEPTLLDLAAQDVPPANRTPIAFSVRPSISENSDFVVSLDVAPILKWRLAAFVSNAKKQHNAEKSNQAVQPTETSPTEPSTVPSGVGLPNDEIQPEILYEEIKRLNTACVNAGGGVSGSPDCDAAIVREEGLKQIGYCIDYTNDEKLVLCDEMSGQP
ncbi:MAG: hypothetical protein R3D83_08040 [Caenibius sp.]